MKIYENPAVANWAIQRMRDKMVRPRKPDEPFHAAELFQCPRKTILNRTRPEEYDTDSLLKFAVGFALQEWFLGPEEDSLTALGVYYSPDRVEGENILEFKSTRRSYERLPKDEHGKPLRGFPKIRFDILENQGWIDRTCAYCALNGLKQAHILVFFLFQNVLSAWTLKFTEAELEQAAQDIVRRRNRLEMWLKTSREVLPSVKLRSWEGECGTCPYQVNYCLAELKKEGMGVEE